jgi:hypothetical protein
MTQPFRPRFRNSVSIGLLLLFATIQTYGQTPYRPEGRIVLQQFILPWDGPGAAVFNPALLAETRHADARFGIMQSTSGKAGSDIMQASVMSPWGISAGFAVFTKESGIDGSNAVYETSIRHLMLAYGHRDFLGSGYDLGVGMARVSHVFNAFGVIKSTSNAYDLGVHGATPLGGLAGNLHAGLTIRNLVSDPVQLPIDNPARPENGYYALRPNVDASLLLKSVMGCVDFYAEFNMREDQDASEGPPLEIPFVKSLGLEYRPFAFAGVKLERTWNRLWTAGLVVRAPLEIPILDGVELGAEANVSHDRFLSPKDEGRGFLGALALNVSL